jgi:hypothetical protein
MRLAIDRRFLKHDHVLMSATRGFKIAAADGKELRRLIATQIALMTAGLRPA